MNHIGEKYGRLQVLADLGPNRTGHKVVRCRCDCGSIKAFPLGRMRNGGVKSCGCLRREMAQRTGPQHNGYRHGHATAGETPTYCSWRAMINRCLNPNDPRYADYGGRGISVCDEWKLFPAFLADMGERPTGQTLDRIKNHLGYSADNCKWSTPAEQMSNRRTYKCRAGSE